MASDARLTMGYYLRGLQPRGIEVARNTTYPRAIIFGAFSIVKSKRARKIPTVSPARLQNSIDIHAVLLLVEAACVE
jgi:hypothetical protein